jgi:hypothetical protein
LAGFDINPIKKHNKEMEHRYQGVSVNCARAGKET